MNKIEHLHKHRIEKLLVVDDNYCLKGLITIKDINKRLICGTPTPATIRVVHIEPGPIPTLTQSAPAFANSLTAALRHFNEQRFAFC
mgnify:CR=1 FL=1